MNSPAMRSRLRNTAAAKWMRPGCRNIVCTLAPTLSARKACRCNASRFRGGFLTSDQLVRIADASAGYGSGFMHFTTREDAQIYYVQLEQVPELLRFLAEGGITSREASGNTVRNITACYRAGTSAPEAFVVSPNADALYFSPCIQRFPKNNNHFPRENSCLSSTQRTTPHKAHGRLQQLYNKTHLPKRESACTLHNGFKSAAPRFT